MSRSMKIKLSLFTIFLPLIISGQNKLDGIAAIVAEKVILRSDVYQMAQMEALRNQIDISTNPQAIIAFQASALEGLIVKSLLIARAKVDSLDEVNEILVDSQIDLQIDNMVARLGSEEAFKDVIGQSIREFRNDRWFDTRDDIIAQNYRAAKIKNVKISRPEVIAFYNTYKDSIPPIESKYELSQLVVPIVAGDDAREKAYNRVLQIQQLLTEGVDFGQIARDFSDDKGSASNDGDLGLVQRGQFVLPFEETAFSMEIDEVSDIVESIFGYHIIQLLDRQGEKIHARHILISPHASSQDREKALNKIREYYFTLEEDPSLFDTLIAEIKAEHENISDIGYIGWIEYSRLPGDNFKSAVFGAKSGMISPPFESPEGFHILNILNFREGGKANLNDFYPQLESLALRKKQDNYFIKWLSQIRKEVFIKYFK